MIAPDYPGFGHSDIPDPAKYAYTFDGISEVIQKFLALKGFDRYGLYVQDYGGPVGFRIVGRNPGALEWLIIQNSNAYEVGFTPAWDGLRNALWVHRSVDTEQPLRAFLERDTIKTIYLHGAQRPELVSPDNWESDVAFMTAAERDACEPRSVFRLSDERPALSCLAGVSARAPTEDAHLVGSARHLLHR